MWIDSADFLCETRGFERVRVEKIAKNGIMNAEKILQKGRKEKIMMIDTILSSVISFIGTNIDDIFVDTLLFSQADNGKKARQVVLGKYLGIGTLVLVSIAISLGIGRLLTEYIAFLGIVPILLGVKAIVSAVKNDDDDEEASKKSENFILNTALMTAAGGGDNIGVYVPLFAGFGWRQIVVMVCVFAVMTAVWCALGKRLASLPMLGEFLRKYKRIIIPVVYISLGVYIIVGNLV